MFGQHNSVVLKLMEGSPGISTSKCICHSLHFCASEACKVLSRETEGLARNILNFFNYCSKRQTQLGEFQEFYRVKPHKMLGLAQSKWLPLTEVVRRIKDQWSALKLYLAKELLSIYMNVNFVNRTNLSDINIQSANYFIPIKNHIGVDL